MNRIKSARSRSAWIGTVVLAVALAGLVAQPGRAADLVGFYAGGAFGQPQLEAGTPTFGSFKANHTAYELMMGLRPIAPIGVELEYLDFGHPNGTVGGWPTDLSTKGTAA